MAEQYIKAEIVKPAMDAEKWLELIFAALFMVALTTLFGWWFFASWFPEFGLTYWQLVLPVVTIRLLFGSTGVRARVLKK